ncbi:MAG: DUF1186 domain-containing protein [Cyanobacteria bacterium J06635_10]
MRQQQLEFVIKGWWKHHQTRNSKSLLIKREFLNMQLSEIISNLENNNGKLPRQALQRAIEEREAITPLLLDVLSNCKNNLEELSNKPDYILHICAFYLLAQFRESQAYPLLIDFFSIPGKMPVDATGNLVGEDLGRILASVCHGNIEPVKQLIENKEIDRFVRSAAFESLIILVVQEIISREKIIQYYEELFLNIYADKPSVSQGKKKQDYILADLVMNSSMLAPVELQQYIEQTFDEGLIRPLDFERREFKELLEIGPEATLNALRNDIHYSLIEDAISDIESNCFMIFPFPQTHNTLTEVKGFSNSPKSKSKVKNKKKMQQESRRKNRSKKK